MKTFTATELSGNTIEYIDRKRTLWLLSLFYPLMPLTGVGLMAWTGLEVSLFLPLVLTYVGGPLSDWIFGVDKNNPPEAVVPQLDADSYYRILTYLTVPLHFVALLVTAWWAGTQDLSWWGLIVLAVSVGVGSGLGINTGHELGHKKSKLERNLAKIVLAVPAYGHFCIEHNRGHHRDVSTPADPASARMGESIYQFVLREIPGAIRRAWDVERQRLGRKGHSVWHWKNDILQSHAIALIVQLSLLFAFGWIMIPFLIIHNVIAWWQLTSANYIEHYGLLREKKADGRFERCQPWHSWNSNHIYSNLLLFHLERHSDHHANPTRRYQSLRDFENLPQLPNGYFGMFLVAYIPWLWFRIMDPRLIALPHIQGDITKINVKPGKLEKLLQRYPALNQGLGSGEEQAAF